MDRHPQLEFGAITPLQRQQLIQNSVVAGAYEKVVDRESAYERLKGYGDQPVAVPQMPTRAPSQLPGPQSSGGWLQNLPSLDIPTGGGGRRGDTVLDAMMKSAVRSIGSTVGRQLIRGVMGSLLGGGSRR
jgi:uncharacterized protein